MSLEAAARHPVRFAAMGPLPLAAPDSRDRVREWCVLPGMFGARLNFLNAAQRQLRDGTADWIFQAAEQDGLALMRFVGDDFPAAGTIAERHPGLRIVLDHLGVGVDRRGPSAFGHLP